MSRWDDIKKLKDAATAKIEETDFAKLAGDAVLGASNIVEGAEAVAQRSGMTKKNGAISKLKVAKVVLQPRKTTRKVFDATADEIRSRREVGGDAAPTGEEREL